MTAVATVPMYDPNDGFGNEHERIETVAIEDIQVVGRTRQIGDVSGLARSIDDLGLLHPIILTPNLRLVSGERRLAAYKLLGKTEIKARIIPFNTLEATLAEIDENFECKPLTFLEKAEQFSFRKKIYETLNPSAKHGGNHGNQYTGGKKGQEGITPFCQFAGDKTGMSSTTVGRLVRVGNVTQEARNILRPTPFADSMNDLCKLARINKEPERQIAVAKHLADGTATSVPEAKLIVEREETLAKPCHLPQQNEDYWLINDDFVAAANQIEDGSIDLILTDPPYFGKDLWVFDKLGEFAAKKLKDGGSLVVMVGQYYLPQILKDFSKHTELNWQWQFNCEMKAPNAFVASRRVEVTFKPLLWYVKGQYKGRSLRDSVKSSGIDKRWHELGQSENQFRYFVELLSKHGQLVCEPFMGGGTTVIAALRTGRKVIGIDIDSKSVQITIRRIDELKAEMAKEQQASHSSVPETAIDDDEPQQPEDEAETEAGEVFVAAD